MDHRRDPSLLPADAAPGARASEADRVGVARCVRRRDARRRRPHRLQPVPEGGYAALPRHGRDAGRQQPRRDRSRAALRGNEAPRAAAPRVAFLEPRAWQPQDLLQRDRQRGRQQLRRRVREAAKYDPTDTPRELDAAAPRAGEVSERAHPRAGIPQRAADHGADRGARHRSGPGSTVRRSLQKSRRSSRRRPARATSRIRCACAART